MSGVRKRYGASERPGLLEQWSRSGESAERFAARIGVRPSTLSRWQKEAAKLVTSAPRLTIRKGKKSREDSASMFTRVQVVEAPRRAGGLVEVVTREGYVVRVHGEVDSHTLTSVLGALARC